MFDFTMDPLKGKKMKGLVENINDLTAVNSSIVFSLIILGEIDSEGINRCNRHGGSGGEKLLNFAQNNPRFIWKEDRCNNASSLFTNTKVIPVLYDSNNKGSAVTMTSKAD